MTLNDLFEHGVDVLLLAVFHEGDTAVDQLSANFRFKGGQ
jgi:hypothetical protein